MRAQQGTPNLFCEMEKGIINQPCACMQEHNILIESNWSIHQLLNRNMVDLLIDICLDYPTYLNQNSDEGFYAGFGSWSRDFQLESFLAPAPADLSSVCYKK